MKLTIYFVIASITWNAAKGQSPDLTYGDNSKEEIIDSMHFVDSIAGDSLTDVLRFEHVGAGSGGFIPLAVSEKSVIKRRPLEFLPMKVNRRELQAIERFVKKCDTRVYKQTSGENGIFRITYRIKNGIYQYFIPNSTEAVKYFDQLQNQLKELKNNEIDLKIIMFRRSNGI